MFQVRVALGPLDRSRWTEVDVVVDTGATLTKIPPSLAKELGLVPEGTVTVRLGNGHLIERVVASAVIRCEGRERTIPVSVGEESETAVLGATAMEILSLSPDPVNEVLVPTVAYELLAVAG